MSQHLSNQTGESIAEQFSRYSLTYNTPYGAVVSSEIGTSHTESTGIKYGLSQVVLAIYTPG